MTRVIAGTAKGQRLVVPDMGTRPTSDRIRESIFARLDSWNAVANAETLDLFAGSGALAIESLSRGASRATLVDSSAKAIKSVNQNLASTGLSGRASVTRQRALAFLQRGADGTLYELIFVDPPYAMSETELSAHLELLSQMVTNDATIVIERAARSPEPVIPTEWEMLSSRKWGDTAAWFAAPIAHEK
ncbi:16S rRNA (guanine(966)-N(2))-methyltransferase RsmD [Actinomycetaceae bacterium MB13-C1-2]|nr:16S rRNA (guanine(966)-N(2))-methyltransferase RsmD [Actinomycetaceae bacterium MB13-C1-2]